MTSDPEGKMSMPDGWVPVDVCFATSHLKITRYGHWTIECSFRMYIMAVACLFMFACPVHV
jgi:hypothetical protein